MKLSVSMFVADNSASLLSTPTNDSYFESAWSRGYFGIFK